MQRATYVPCPLLINECHKETDDNKDTVGGTGSKEAGGGGQKSKSQTRLARLDPKIHNNGCERTVTRQKIEYCVVSVVFVNGEQTNNRNSRQD